MKYITTLLVLLTATTAIGTEPPETNEPPSLTATKYRTFNDADGTETQAHLLDFSESTGNLKMELSDGSRQTKTLLAFSEEDQAFIKDWYSAYSLLSRKRLRITLDKKKVKNDHRSSYRKRTQDEKEYEFALENKSGNSLDDIYVEYCIYIHTEVETRTTKGRRDPQPAPGTYTGYNLMWVSLEETKEHPAKIYTEKIKGDFLIKQLLHRDEVLKKTQPLVLPKDQKIFTFSDFLRTETKTDTKLLGIRYRVHLPTPDGNYAMMEFAEPKSLLKETEWPSATQTESKQTKGTGR